MKLHSPPAPATNPRMVAFLQEHQEDMHRISPPESVHALAVEQLRRPDVGFRTAWAPQEV